MDKARESIKSMLGKTITLHPCANGMGRYLTAEVTGDYTGLLRLATGQNKFGGGHPLPDLFYPTIRVPQRPTQVVVGLDSVTI